MDKIREWQEHIGPVLDSVNNFEIIECRLCQFKHIVPIPTPAELEDIYRQSYYSMEKPLYLERHKEDLDWLNLCYRERYDTFEKLLPANQRHILDVGSGPGFFLLYGRKRGWQTLGFEPSTQAACHSRNLGLEIIEEFLTEETGKYLGKFDVVHMSEVLEHIPDPIGMLRIAQNLLNPGGILCVAVPNDYNPFQIALRKALGYPPWWLAPPHHINYFNPDSLGSLFIRYGFEISLAEATFPIDLFLLMGDNYIGNDIVGRQCHEKRKRFEQNLASGGLGEIKRHLYQNLASQGLGREIILFGIRR